MEGLPLTKNANQNGDFSFRHNASKLACCRTSTNRLHILIGSYFAKSNVGELWLKIWHFVQYSVILIFIIYKLHRVHSQRC